jgi:hypothetical protein
MQNTCNKCGLEARHCRCTKYEPTIVEYSVYADDISIYPDKAMPGLITYGSNGPGEKKQLQIKVRLIKTENREHQVVLELCGDYHIEKIVYCKSKPDTWNSYGKIWISKEQTKQLLIRLTNILKEMEGS